MRRLLLRGLVLLACVGPLHAASAADVPEYELKAAFLYNFGQFTEWPATTPPTLDLCTFGSDPFGAALDALAGKPVGSRTLRLRRGVDPAAIPACHILYVGRDAIASLPAVRAQVAGHPVLIVTDSPGAARSGATINMTLVQGRITFEINRQAARQSQLELSFRLLRLATEVIQ